MITLVLTGVLLTCQPSPSDNPDGYYFWWAPDETAEPEWRSFSIGTCELEIDADEKGCWRVSAVQYSTELMQFEESEKTNPACIEIRIKGRE